MESLRDPSRVRWLGVAAALTRAPTPAVRSYRTLLCMFWLVYPIAVAGTVLDVRPPFPMAWAASALLFLQAGTVAAWAWARAGAWRAALALALVAAGGLGAEVVGVATGLPFGRYHYTAVLAPLLPGHVPLAVVCAWVYVVFAATTSARVLLARYTEVRQLHAQASSLAVIGLAAILALGLDLLLEPVAVRVEGYWVWDVTGPYYGVPLANFVAWTVLAAVFVALVEWIVLRQPAWRAVPPRSATSAAVASQPTLRGPAGMYVAGVAMFGLIDLSHRAWVAAVIGIGLVALMGWGLRRATA